MADKEALIELLSKMLNFHRATCYLIADQLVANNVVIQKRAHWHSVKHEDPRGDYYLWHCSNCDAPSATRRNYCHDCGAKMEVDPSV